MIATTLAPVKAAPTVLEVRLLLAARPAPSDPGWKTAVQAVRDAWGLSRGEAVALVRAASAGTPLARLADIADARIHGLPASGDPWQLDQETDAAVEAHYRGRGDR